MQECFFEERGIYYRMNVLQPGRPTIVFIHGVSGSSSAWLPYERMLEDRYNILSPDIRGHGKSRKLLFYSMYAPELIASDIIALLKHHQVSHCFIIGHSFGTLLALAAIKQQPDLFLGVVFISPTYDAGSRWWFGLARVLTTFFLTLSLFLPFDPEPRSHVDYERLIPTWDWSPRRIFRDIRNTSMRVYFFCVRHLYARDTNAWWQGLQIPTLIVHGKKDTIISSENVERLHKLVPGSKFTLVDNADHMLLLNYPKKVCSILEKFIGAYESRTYY